MAGRTFLRKLDHLHSRRNNQRGASLAEYVILLVLILVLAYALVQVFGFSIAAYWSKAIIALSGGGSSGAEQLSFFAKVGIYFTDPDKKTSIWEDIWNGIKYAWNGMFGSDPVVTFHQADPADPSWLANTTNNQNTATIVDWTQQDMNNINDLFDTLPNSFSNQFEYTDFYSVKETTRLDKDGNLVKDVLGLTAYNGEWIAIDQSAYNSNDFNDKNTNYKATVLHELVHSAVDKNLWTDVITNYENALEAPEGAGTAHTWNKVGDNYVHTGPEITNYSKTSPSEHLAESVMFYVYNGQKLYETDRRSYNFIKHNLFGGKTYYKEPAGG
jgi:hypothetical protein